MMCAEDSRDVCEAILEALLEQRGQHVKGGLYWENQIAFAYNSEKIEGSPLTEEQTRSIFETGTVNTGGYIAVDHIFEMRNHFRMFDYMLDTIEEPLSADLIKGFHRILEQADGAGEWKTVPNSVGGITTTPPGEVDGAIARLLAAYDRRSQTTYHDIVGFHVFYETIHPFLDGNGRTGRMVMFRECLRCGLVPFIVIDAEKGEYCRSIRIFTDDDGQRFVRFAERMAELYLEEFTSLMPKHLLLPSLEPYVKQPAFDDMDLSFFDADGDASSKSLSDA